MELDLELYRYSVTVHENPPVRLSVIDVHPENPQRTYVLLHGFGGQATQWDYQFDALGTRNRVISLDLRGHGKSDAPGVYEAGGYTLQQVLDDLEFVLIKLGAARPFVLAGHSFGGAVALEYALRHPEHLSHLILVATAGEFQLGTLEKLALSLPLFVLRLMEPLTRRWMHARPHAVKAWYKNILNPWRGWEMMKGITIPTLVIKGHRDRVFPKAAFDQVADTIPNAEEVDVGAAGHLVQLERRDAVNRAIARFVDARQRSWREETGVHNEGRARLLKERPWLKFYEEGVPETVAVPPVPLQLLLRAAVRRFPLHPAIIFEGRKITYRALNHDANRFANALLGLGLARGGRVLLAMPNVPQTPVAIFGTLKAGGVPVITPETSAETLVQQAESTGARIVVTMRAIKGLEQFVGKIDHLILAGLNDGGANPFPGARDFIRLVNTHKRASPPNDAQPDELALILYTGGTTGEPKGVMLSHRNLIANAIQTRHWMQASHAGRERFLCVLPFSHPYGLMTGLIIPLALGATMILKQRFEIVPALEAIRKYKPTIFPGVPSMYLALMSFHGVRQYGIESINACLSGSEPLAVEIQEEFEKLTRGRLVEGYGLAEAAPVTHANPMMGHRKVGSIGLPLPSTEARIVDLKTGTKPVKPGGIGELEICGPQVMMGYWNDDQCTADALYTDERGRVWLRTGDVALMDEDGYFRLIARKADMWFPAKETHPAFPRDVEEVLYEIPHVKEAAVVAIAGRAVGFVIPRSGCPAAEELIAYCQRRLSAALAPRLIIFVDEFPRTFIGKIMRRELAKRYEEQEAAERETAQT
jgi:long-chain acyl-CoA synthetase